MLAEIRRCAACGGDMHVAEESRGGRQVFVCEECGKRVEIEPSGNIGALLGMGLVAAGAVGSVLWGDGGLSGGEAVALVVILTLFLAPALDALRLRRRHPVLGREERAPPPVTARRRLEIPLPNVLRRAGLLAGVLAVLAFTLLWIVVWSVVSHLATR